MIHNISMPKSPKSFKKIFATLKVIGVNLLIFLGLLGLWELYESSSKPQELAISNTLFDREDILEGGSLNEKSDSWTLPSEQKLANLRKRGLEKRYMIQVLKQIMNDDPTLGTKPQAKVSTLARSFYQGRLIYDVRYEFDEFSRRITPYKEKSASKFIATFGGSFAFGDGVKSDQTLAYFLGELTAMIPYNYGAQGYGPQHMYLQIERGLAQEIKYNSGIGVYLYLPHHRNRLIGSMKELHWSQGRFPYLELDDDGPIVHHGTFKEARPLYTKLLEKLANFDAFASRVADFPRASSATTKLCRLIEESRQKFNNQFLKSDFIVVIGPGTDSEDDLAEKCLIKKKIPFVDARGIKARAILSGVENHYRPQVYREMAQELSRFMKRQGEP